LIQTILLAEREFKFVQIKGQVLFKGEIIAKIVWGHFKEILKNHWTRNAQIYIKAS
jgi:hypothetical protein